jgi:FixJ family two-component response regulator
MVEDKRAPVADQVAAKMDIGAWFATLTRRMRQIAKDLAFGCTTSEVAEKYGVTAGRISQLRRTLEASWVAFQQETSPALVQ